MKKLMFAQSRFVFMAGGGAEGPSHAETVKQMSDMLKEPSKDLAKKQDEADRLDRVARNTISQLPDEEQRPARVKLIALKSRLDQAIAAAKEAQGMGDQSEMDKLVETGKDFLAVKEAEVKIASRQMKLNGRIEEAKDFYKVLLNGNSIDGDLRLDLEDLMTNLGQVKSKVEDAPGIDSTDTQLDQWASGLGAEVGKYEVSGKAAQEAFANNTRRGQIKERVSNDRDVMGTMKDYLRDLAKGNNGDVSAADAAFQALDAIKEPANRSGKEAWEKYSSDVQQAVAQLTAGRDDFTQQVREKQALDKNIAAKLDTVGEGWEFQKGPELKKAQKKAEDALKEIGSVGPKFGDTSRHGEYQLAMAKAGLVMNEFDGEKASQDVVKSGGRDALLVYKDLQAGKFQTVADFQKAFKEALEKDRTVAGYNPDSDVAQLEAAAGKLSEIGTAKLQQQEAMAKMVADAITKTAEGAGKAVDAMIKGLGDLADKGASAVENASVELAKAGDKARYEAAVKAVADAKAGLEGKGGRAARVAREALAALTASYDPTYADGNKPGTLDYSSVTAEAKDVVAKYQKDAAKESQVAAARRKAAKVAKEGGVTFDKDGKPIVTLGEKPKGEHYKVQPIVEAATNDSLDK